MRVLGSSACFLTVLALPGVAMAGEPDKVIATNAPPADPAVYGGEVVEECAWPSVVSMGGSCTGTLVHPELVIYAAHCGGNYNSVTFGQSLNGAAFQVPTEYCKIHHPVDNSNLGGGEDVAFCKLAQPVTNVPITPILMGCETSVLHPGREIVAVGFGQADNGPYGIKREVTVQVDQVGVEVTGGGDGMGVCSGDSGGPVFVKLAADEGGDDTWRVWGIASWAQMPQQGVCNGYSGWGMMHTNMEWFETESGIDLTPCHDADGTWNPTPQCNAFPMDPGGSGHGTWSGGCEMGPVGGFSEICGDPVPQDDFDAPIVSITTPESGVSLPSEDGVAGLGIEATADDNGGWGVQELRLLINGSEVPMGTDTTAPYDWWVALPPGGYTLQVVARDFAGNEAFSEEVQVGVDQDAPEPPDDGNDDGAAEGEVGTDGGAEGETGSDPQADDGAGESKGCACDLEPGAPSWSLALFGLLGLTRRRRRA